MAATEPTAVAPPSPAVSGEAVEKAVKALLKWKDCQPNSEKPQLLSSDEFVYLVVTVKKIPPKSRTNPYKIPLIHPLFSPAGDGSELCLFLDDRPDRRPTSKDAKAKIAGESIPIPKVIKLSKLKTDYKPFEAKRKLCDSYDLFLADRRIIPLLPKHLGKHFFKKKKIPVAVDLEHQNWKEQVERLCSCALLHLKTGTCSTVRVARSSMAAADIVENVVAAINGVAETVPKKWNNFRSLHLKLSDSVALPIYQCLPEANMNVNAAVAEGKKRGREEVAAVAEGKKRGREEGEDVLSSKKIPKASSKKGRIHQVRYMDDEVVSEEEQDVGDEEKNGVVKIKKAKKKEASKVELVEADGGKKKRVKKEASKVELVEADGGKKKRVKKEASSDELVEADGDKKKKKVKKESNKDELVGADGAKKKKAGKVELVEADGAKKKEASKDELVEADGAKKKKVKKESSKDELVEADGAKKKKVKKESSKDELVEADGAKKKKVKKESSKDELVEADGAKKKKAGEVELVKADGAKKKEASKDKLVKADGAKKKKVKTVASKDELVESDGANLKKENKVRKVSNVAKSGSAKRSKRS